MGFTVINEEKYIVEIKNRKNYIFDKIPIYEKIQIYFYMKSCNISKAIHIQNKDEEYKEIIITDWTKYEKSMFEIVDKKLIIISKFLNELKLDNELKNKIIHEKNISLLKTYIS